MQENTERKTHNTSYYTKKVDTHPDIHTYCTQCDRRITNGSLEYFTHMAGPGFCNKACMKAYYNKTKGMTPR
jgi:hypothetical protein